ncbi:MAG: hypothetical protein K2H98_09335 [Duncaniella sp.]|nr:hypothetical protein [Duncaniella sp.]
MAGSFVPADGDRVRMLGVEWIEPPVRDVTRPFDTRLPGVDVTRLEVSGEFEIQYCFLSDSVFCEQRPDSRREYLVAGDTLRLLTTESYEIIIHETEPPVWMAAMPTSGVIARTVLRHQREHYAGRGVMSQGVRGLCDVVIAPGDTLHDVTVHSVRTECRYSRPQLIDALPVDAPVDSSMIFVEEITSWYARGCRYPVIQSWSSVVTDTAGTELYGARASAVVTPDGMPYDADGVSGLNDGSEGGAEGYPAAVGYPNSATYDPSRLSVEASGGDVHISYEAGGDMEIEMVLADIQGHVYAACARRRVSAGQTYDFHVSRTALPPGDYVLYICNGDERVTEKLPLR